MCLFTSSGLREISTPATTALPEVGLLSPQSIRMAVVLPAPLAPRKPNISPLATLNDIWSTAVKLPNLLVSDSAYIAFSLILPAVKFYETILYRGLRLPQGRRVVSYRGKPSGKFLPPERGRDDVYPVPERAAGLHPLHGGDIIQSPDDTALHIQLVHALAESLHYGLRCVCPEKPPVLHQRYDIALRRLVHVGRTHHYGDTLSLQSGEHLPELLAADRVHAGGRLVEEEDAGLVDHRAAQSQFLLHAAGKLPRPPHPERFQLAVNLRHKVVVLLNAGVEHGCEKGKVLLDGKILVQGEMPGHVPYHAAYLHEILADIAAAHPHLTRARHQQGRHYPEESGLAGPVRTDNPEYGAALHLQADPVQRRDPAVAHAYIPDRYI